MNHDPRKISKSAILAEISLADGSTICGNLFQTNQGRVTDLLNDDRKFLPVQTVEGQFLAIAKSAIQKVSLSTPPPAPYRGNNPWHILGVKEGVSAEELKRAYYELVRAHHPDRIKGMGLGSEYQELANRNMMRINDAYAELLKTISSGSA